MDTTIVEIFVGIFESIFSQRGSYRLFVISAFGFLIAIIFSVAKFSSSLNNTVGDANVYLFFISSILAVFGLIIFSASRLDLLRNSNQRDFLDSRVLELAKEVESLHGTISVLSEKTANEKKLIEISEQVFSTRIENRIEEIAVDNLTSIVKEKIIEQYKPSIYKSDGFNSISNIIKEYISGIHREILRQRRAANQNLIWGVFFSVAGLFIMGSFLFGPLLYPALWSSSEIHAVQDWNSFVREFIPRFTFVIIFESVAFFFLRAYSDDRSMIKYLRNEATNSESKAIALLSSIYFGDDNTQSKIFGKLMETERNFIIKKGERVLLEVLKENSTFIFEDLLSRISSTLKPQK